MLVELWDFSIPNFAEIPSLFCANVCSVQFAKELCGAAGSEWTSWRQGSSDFRAEDCSRGSAQ